VKRSDIDYVITVNGDYNYEVCELNYKEYEINSFSFGIYDIKNKDYIAVKVPEEYQDKLSKMLDLWLKI